MYVCAHTTKTNSWTLNGCITNLAAGLVRNQYFHRSLFLSLSVRTAYLCLVSGHEELVAAPASPGLGVVVLRHSLARLDHDAHGLAGEAPAAPGAARWRGRARADESLPVLLFRWSQPPFFHFLIDSHEYNPYISAAKPDSTQMGVLELGKDIVSGTDIGFWA